MGLLNPGGPIAQSKRNDCSISPVEVISRSGIRKIYKQIRKMRLDGMSQRQIAAVLRISRNTVKKYWDGNSVPWERKDYSREASVLTEGVVTFVQKCLDEDARNPRKQHHTAKRIYDRLVAECGFTGGETTVRRLVRELREKPQEVFIPLAFPAGDAMQIDRGEATVYLGGVPRRVIFDNGKVAVKDGFGAHARKQAGYAALAAHYGFEAVFCNPASGHEKGLVEGLVGYSRRNTCVPVPRVDTMEELNRKFREKCQKYLSHQIRGKEASVGSMFAREKAQLYPLSGYPFDPCKRASGRVDRFCTVRFDTNNYSVPAAYCGREVAIKAGPETVSIYYEGQCIAQHCRCLERNQSIYALEHYLPLLEKKGRAIFYVRPVQDTLPEYFLHWLQKQDLSPKELVEILSRCKNEDYERIMEESAFYAAPVHIEDTVMVQAVDLHVYDSFLRGKAGVSV